MNSYYQSLFIEIERKIKQEAYREAYDLIYQEISLPYVPKECLEKLEEYKDICRPYVQADEQSRSMDSILSWVEDPQRQEVVIPLFRNLNLRSYTREVQILLNAKIPEERKGELIEYLMEQKIDSPFQIEKNGWEITFVPSTILPSKDDETVLEVLAIFDRWFSNDDPGFLHFCQMLLNQEILAKRPFDFSEEEALPIAKAIVRLVSEASGQDDVMEKLAQKENLYEVQDVVLCIESKGEFK